MSYDRLASRVALITGGATGIGQAIALCFAREGASVVIADVNEAQGRATAAAARGHFVHCDVSDPDQVRAAVGEAETLFGGLDILVASAAHLGGMNDAAAMPAAEWHAVLGVTLDGVFYAAKYAVPAMINRGGGSIILISSVEGISGVAGHVAYVTGKSALFGLTRSLAIDYGKHKIRVNALSPGIIDSGRPDIEHLKQDPTHLRWWCDMTVLDRLGQPEEVAAAALFLASNEASYITGQNLAVDGGWTIGHPPIPGS